MPPADGSRKSLKSACFPGIGLCSGMCRRSGSALVGISFIGTALVSGGFDRVPPLSPDLTRFRAAMVPLHRPSEPRHAGEPAVGVLGVAAKVGSHFGVGKDQ